VAKREGRRAKAQGQQQWWVSWGGDSQLLPSSYGVRGSTVSFASGVSAPAEIEGGSVEN